MSNSCSKCSDARRFRKSFEAGCLSSKDIHWYQWDSGETGFHVKKETKSTVGKAIDEVSKQLPRFIWHSFIKNQQAESFLMQKEKAILIYCVMHAPVMSIRIYYYY